MPNRSSLPTIYTASYTQWYENDQPHAGSLPIFDVTYLHFHNTLELGYCTQGEGICYVDGKEYPFKAGDVEIIFPFQNHLSKKTGSEDSLWYWTNVEPLHLFSQWGMSNISDVKHVLENEMSLCGIFSPEEYPAVNALTRKILLLNNGAVSGGVHTTETLNASLYLLLMELASASLGKPPLPLRKLWGFDEILPAILLVSAALKDGRIPSETELCAACSMSTATLRRKFKSLLGISVQQYITSCRIQEAVRLLLFTNKSILEIALSIGYQDASGFVKLFYDAKGCSPSHFRKQYHSADLI